MHCKKNRKMERQTLHVDAGDDQTMVRTRIKVKPKLTARPKVYDPLEDVPSRFHDLVRRAHAGTSRKSSIRAFCLECCGWINDETAYCTSKHCFLYPFRKNG